jgi:hypothetical protein
MLALFPVRSIAFASALVLASAATSCVPDVGLRDPEPDAGSACEDGELRNGETPCGLNLRGRLQQRCNAGKWQNTVCDDPDECLDETARGSCAADAGEACLTGRWVPGPCLGCGVVDCASSVPGCCAGVIAFAFDTSFANFANRPDLVTSFTPEDQSVEASYSFDAAGQRGAIGFDLPGPMRIDRVAVLASRSGAGGSPYVTLDSARGTNGCAYDLYLGEIDLFAPLFCWGSFDYRATTRINIRIDATLAAAATLRVDSVAINPD